MSEGNSQLVKLFENVVKEVVEKVKERKMSVSISEIAKCLRYSYYQTVRPMVSEKMVLGIEAHEYVERVIKDVLSAYGLNCESEYRVAGGARVDVLCVDKYLTPYVIELKFTSNPSSENPFMTWYLRQLRYYMALVMSSNSYRRSVGVLMLLSYEYDRYYVHTIEMSESEMESVLREIEDRMSALGTAKQTGTAPKEERGPWCQYCPYRRQCGTAQLL